VGWGKRGDGEDGIITVVFRAVGFWAVPLTAVTLPAGACGTVALTLELVTLARNSTC